MNTGQAFGLLQLRIHELEASSDAGLREEVDRAIQSAAGFGLQLEAAKREIESLNETVHQLRMAAKAARQQPAPARKAAVSSAEVALREENTALVSQLRVATANLTEAKQRIARLEAASKAAIGVDELAQAQEQAAEYKRHIERLEAEARGYAMQIADLRRQRDEANSLAGKLQQEIDELLKQPAKVVEVAATECPTCSPIIHAIAQAVMSHAVVEANEPLPATHAPPPSARLPKRRARTNGADVMEVSGTRQAIARVLREASEPMSAGEIAALVHIRESVVWQQLSRIMTTPDSPLMRLGSPGGKRDPGAGYRYWLRERPLPQGASA